MTDLDAIRGEIRWADTFLYQSDWIGMKPLGYHALTATEALCFLKLP